VARGLLSAGGISLASRRAFTAGHSETIMRNKPCAGCGPLAVIMWFRRCPLRAPQCAGWRARAFGSANYPFLAPRACIQRFRKRASTAVLCLRIHGRALPFGATHVSRSHAMMRAVDIAETGAPDRRRRFPEIANGNDDALLLLVQRRFDVKPPFLSRVRTECRNPPPQFLVRATSESPAKCALPRFQPHVPPFQRYRRNIISAAIVAAF